MDYSKLYSIGEALKMLRLKMGLTQEELSIRCGKGVTLSYISKIESGKTQSNPSSKTILKLAKGLGVTPAVIWFHAIDISKLNESDQNIYNNISALFDAFTAIPVEDDKASIKDRKAREKNLVYD